MRLLRHTLPGRLCSAGSGAGCVVRPRALHAFSFRVASTVGRCRHLHGASSVCQRLATLQPPLRVSKHPNVRLVKDHAEFYNAVYTIPERDRVRSEDLVISVFVTHQNTGSLSILECVDQLSREYSGNKFLIIDADQVPRAAYDADLQQFPAVLLSFGGDIYRRLVQVTGGYPNDWQAVPRWDLPSNSQDDQPSVECTLPGNLYASVKSEIASFAANYHGKEIASLKSRCGTHSYTHGIDTDNLNVKRVGWPTE
ncbi:RNA-binding protein, putative [Babesia ovis]|uniref:RNA-binding protein, putative n=1 Tax=Babesia ovis TaxID=5869 RepID=A0A9W5T8J4_BABOV|nr:RNA-binding protein, putative [Babesia ovis]